MVQIRPMAARFVAKTDFAKPSLAKPSRGLSRHHHHHHWQHHSRHQDHHVQHDGRHPCAAIRGDGWGDGGGGSLRTVSEYYCWRFMRLGWLDKSWRLRRAGLKALLYSSFIHMYLYIDIIVDMWACVHRFKNRRRQTIVKQLEGNWRKRPYIYINSNLRIDV